MEELVKEIKVNGKTLQIFYDSDPSNPRDPEFMDVHLTKMVCFHKHYTLGDKHEYKHSDYGSWEEMKDAIVEKEKPLVIKPLYMLDHSGITISTSDFNDRWDSGQIGWVYITKKTIDDCGLTIKNGESFRQYKERLAEGLEAEVEEYDQYITGDVYRFVVLDENGDEIDSCGGFYGSDWKNNGLLDTAGADFLDTL